MIEDLDSYYSETRAKLKAMREVCRAEAPDIAAIAHARHELMSASMRRSRFLKDEIFPALVTITPSTASAVDELNRDLAVKRVAVSRHISTWPLERIE
ncbi:MAG: hypothetical protein PGN21_09890 [Sphingomonas paucimobilis]